jgi:hypothetical protein
MKYLNQQVEREAALVYMRDQLAAGKTLSRLLLQYVQLRDGTFGCLTPAPLDPVQTIEFEMGHTLDEQASHRLMIGEIGGTASPKPRTDHLLAEFVRTLLTDPHHVLFLQNSLAEATDPWLKGAKSRVLFYQNEVYHTLFDSDGMPTNIMNAIREAENETNFSGAVALQPGDATRLTSRTESISLAELETLARSAECIFVSAYDGEGYLVWERK